MSVLGTGRLVHIKHNVARAEAYLPTKWHLDPSSRLATTGMGLKLAACAPLGEGELGPYLIQCGLGRGYLHAKLHLDPYNRLATVQQRHKQDKTGQTTV